VSAVLGEFLELSLPTTDPMESYAFWQRVGFASAQVGGAWRHRYASLTDGRIHVGVHEAELPGPTLTFVRPNLLALVPQLEALGIELELCRLGGDEFNQLAFRDPDEQRVCVVEARTFSPHPEPPAQSRLGWCGEYRMPVRSAGDSAAFWERLGFLAGPHAHHDDAQLLAATGINLGAHEQRALRAPALAFYEQGIGARLDRLRESGVEPKRVSRARDGTLERAEIVSPEGLTLLLVEGHL
jgi:hypothetical protein